MTVIGIDTGKDGGIAVIQDGQLVDLMVMPTMDNPRSKAKTKAQKVDSTGFIEVMREYMPHMVFIEEMWPSARFVPNKKTGKQEMFRDSLVSSDAISEAFRGPCWAMESMRIPFQVVAPQTWQKRMLTFKGDTKAASVEVAKRMYPSFTFKRTPRCTTYHDGMADAALIATYGWRQLNGGA